MFRAVQRFELEARAVAALNHPNIVAVYDAGEGYIVSELVDGEPLRAGNLSLRRTMEAAVQLAGVWLLLPDGRIVAPANVSGQTRLMAAAKGKDPLPLLNTPEESAAPMTLAGLREIAFLIGPAPHQTIALADTANGRVTRRIAPGRASSAA